MQICLKRYYHRDCSWRKARWEDDKKTPAARNNKLKDELDSWESDERERERESARDHLQANQHVDASL